MILKALKYSRNKGDENEWTIEGSHSTAEHSTNWLSMNQINLIVGRNASGKSRTIDAIRQISDLLGGDHKTSELIYNTATYSLLFKDESDQILYFLEFEKGAIKQEVLKINNIEKLNRDKKSLFYEQIKKNLSFKTDEHTLAVSRRDSEQQPYLEKLYNWGKNLTHYKFGERLGKNSFVRNVNNINLENVDLKDGNDVTAAFIKGKQLDDKFPEILIEDMSKLDYPVTTVEVGTPKYLAIGSGLAVKEKELIDKTDQLEMSQGMFRALSLLVQLNYSLLAKLPSCILIDDIGEGLDYDRSKNLIDLIINKIKNSSVQVIMTTNDQFIMNKIPLEYWAVIKREKGKAVFFNYDNSKEIFDEFEFTGLNNFSFFSSNYYLLFSDAVH
jgi:predicted ATPase